MQRTTVQRQYKDRLFRMAFREKEHLLTLYNAINGSAYEDPEELEIRTLEDVIYMGIKNDVSFVLDDILCLWEHQSSFNPNMPIRGLGYFAKLYQNYIDENKINLYSSKRQQLPFPQYIVFYNGVKQAEDRIELKLSDAFLQREGTKDKKPSLEVCAVMLNINWGCNRQLMDQCQRLREYSQCIAMIREYEMRIDDREEAVRKAVDRCIAEGLLSDILSKNKAEVIALYLTEYDEQAQREMDRAEAREEGLAEGYMRLIRQIRKKLVKGFSVEDTAEMLEESPELIQRIYDQIGKHPQWTEKELYENSKDSIFRSFTEL